jgi:hypothetical protein
MGTSCVSDERHEADVTAQARIFATEAIRQIEAI